MHSPAQWNSGFDRILSVSGGPFLMQSVTTDRITLVRNPRWYGRPAKISSLVFRYYADDNALAHAMATHAVNIAQPFAGGMTAGATVSLFAGVKGVKVAATPSAVFDHLDLNTRDPLLRDIMVRQAIALAFDPVPVAAAATASFGAPAVVTDNRLLIAGQAGTTDTRGQFGHGNTAAALALLQSDGWVRGSDGIFVKAGQRLGFTVKVTSSNGPRIAEANAIANELASAGILMTVVTEPNAISDAIAHNFQAVIFAWVTSEETVASGQQSIYITGGDDNFGYVSDPVVDADLTNAAKELNVTRLDADLNAADTELWCTRFDARVSRWGSAWQSPRMLCSDGAGEGATQLKAATFDYNHAQWYVAEVLALAARYR